jgi:hypothetical protein
MGLLSANWASALSIEQALNGVAAVSEPPRPAACRANARTGAEWAFGQGGIQLRIYSSSVALTALAVALDKTFIAIGTR